MDQEVKIFPPSDINSHCILIQYNYLNLQILITLFIVLRYYWKMMRTNVINKGIKWGEDP